MSLTSYRAAPPRVGIVFVWWLEDLAATDFPAPWGAVSWALGFFTFEFGMGSCVGTPPWPPGRPNTMSGSGVRTTDMMWTGFWCGFVLASV